MKDNKRRAAGPARRYALFGGTFDPIHEGHLRLAREFARRLGLDRVVLMPTSVPPHKLKAYMAPSEDRLAMCRLAAGECGPGVQLYHGSAVHPPLSILLGGDRLHGGILSGPAL